MAFIKTDPSQTKSVVTLLVILVLAIGAIIFRCSPSAPPKPAKKAEAQSSSARVTFDQVQAQDATRNPFAKPTRVQAEEMVSRGAGRPAINKATLRKLMISGLTASQSNVEIRPIPMPDVSQAASQGENPKPEQKNTETEPHFHLLATVKGADGFSAVMKVNESDTRVVEVGDKLEGGFKIIKLQSDCAVLTNGTDTIVATRQAEIGVQRAEGGK